MLLKAGKHGLCTHLDKPTFSLQPPDRFPIAESGIVEPHHITAFHPVSIHHWMQLGKGFSQLGEGALYLLLPDRPDLLLNLYPLIVCHCNVGSDFHGGRVAKGLTKDKFFRDDVRPGNDRKEMFFERLRVRLLYQERTDLRSDLLAEVSFKEGTRHLSRTKPLETSLVLQSAVCLFHFFPYSLRGNLKADLLLYRAEGFNKDFHGRRREAAAGEDVLKLALDNTLPAIRKGGIHCERGDLNPHPPSSGLDPKSSASANSATLAFGVGDGPPESRTPDPLIKSQLLYRLS